MNKSNIFWQALAIALMLILLYVSMTRSDDVRDAYNIGRLECLRKLMNITENNYPLVVK